jgi:hypothetical protein
MVTTVERLDAIEAKVDRVLAVLDRVEPHLDRALKMLDSPAAKLAGMFRK